jgi:hypothetical protein
MLILGGVEYGAGSNPLAGLGRLLFGSFATADQQFSMAGWRSPRYSSRSHGHGHAWSPRRACKLKLSVT